MMRDREQRADQELGNRPEQPLSLTLSCSFALHHLSQERTPPMLTNELIIREYEALQAEKNARMTQTRLVIWSLFFAALSGFVVAGLQSSLVAYAIAFYPLIASCLARLAGHNEAIINRLKGYL